MVAKGGAKEQKNTKGKKKVALRDRRDGGYFSSGKKEPREKTS